LVISSSEGAKGGPLLLHGLLPHHIIGSCCCMGCCICAMLGLATLDFGVVPWGAASVVRFWALVGAYPSIAVLLNPLNRQ